MDKAERRAQILSRARDVFAKRGYHATNIEDIVQAAGVARGTFYLYFEDKRAIFADLVDRFLARLNMAILRIDPADPSRSVADQTRENISRILTLFLKDPAMTKILLTDAPGLDAAFDRKLQAIYDEVITLIAESLAEGQQLGLVAEGDPRLLAYLSMGAIKELLIQVSRQGEPESVEALTDQVYAFFSRGYLRTDESGARPAAKGAPSRPRSR